MECTAAILHGPHQKYSLETIDLDPPRRGEVLVKMAAVGLCHSDEHLVTGDLALDDATRAAMGRDQYPIIAGHEIAGEVVELGEGVTGLSVGDHVCGSFVPSCGWCRMCVQGKQLLCDNGGASLSGRQLDGTSRHHTMDGHDVNSMCALGGFAEYSVIPRDSLVKIDQDLPLAQAALVSCGVVTGWGSVTYRAGASAGDVIVVVGTGGVGMNAVQGAAMASARYIVAVDPVPFKREQAPLFGATHVVADLKEAYALVSDLTFGRMADKVVVTMGEGDPSTLADVMALVRKAGRVVYVSITGMTKIDARLSLFDLIAMQKELVGSLFGGANPRFDVPMLLDLYRVGKLKLDELITKTYTLDELNQGYQDMRDGRLLRGVVIF